MLQCQIKHDDACHFLFSTKMFIFFNLHASFLGMKVQLYITHLPDMSSIMHYKYMLKDYKEDGGYVLIGSMNLTRSAFLENYEDIVFTSDPYVSTSLNENFENCWQYIEAENQTLLNKTILLDVNLFL